MSSELARDNKNMIVLGPLKFEPDILQTFIYPHKCYLEFQTFIIQYLNDTAIIHTSGYPGRGTITDSCHLVD